MLSDGYVKYEEAEVQRSAIMQDFRDNEKKNLNGRLVAIVIKELMIWGSKCHQNNSPVVCDGYVKYAEAEVDRLEAVLNTNN